MRGSLGSIRYGLLLVVAAALSGCGDPPVSGWHEPRIGPAGPGCVFPAVTIADAGNGTYAASYNPNDTGGTTTMTATEHDSSGAQTASHTASGSAGGPPAGTGAFAPAAGTAYVLITVTGCGKSKLIRWPPGTPL
jgi:hypothetical protein